MMRFAPRMLPTAERLARFAMNRSGMRSRWVQANGVSLHVYDGRGGGDLPPVVLLHGLGAAGATFARVVAHIRPHARRVVVPELPGHGFSAHPGGRRVTPDLLLDAMTNGLDQIIDEPAVLYGNSLGGALALQYAVRRPERVRALVLVSPAGARVPEEEWREVREAFDVTNRRAARKFLDRIYHRPPWFLALFAHEFPDVVKRPAVRELLESARAEDGLHPDELASLRMPILLVWGRSEKLLPVSSLAYFRAHLPEHAIIEEPESFGHAPQLEAPERVADRVLAFARDVVAR